MDLEKRVEKLEAFADDVQHRLSRIEARLDVIEAQLGHMATKALTWRRSKHGSSSGL